MLEVGSRRMYIWKVSRLSRRYSTLRCTWTGFRLGSGDHEGQPTLGCHISRRLSSETLPGGSPSGYMVFGGKFRQFPPVGGPLNPCDSL